MAVVQLSAIVVDDDQAAINYLLDLLKNFSTVKVINSFTVPDEAVKQILLRQPDILFLDVQMPGKTGFDVLKEIRSENYEPHVIFVTGFEKFAIRAIKHATFDYLLKPVNAFELEDTLQRMFQLNKQASNSQHFERLFDNISNTQPLKFNSSTGFVIIHPDEIIYLEASRNYCEFYLTENRIELVTVNMNQVHQKLSASIFFRISRSHIINLEFLQKVVRGKKECHLLVNGEENILKISGSNIKKLEQLFPKKTSLKKYQRKYSYRD